MVRDDILENINNMTQNGFKSGVKKPTLQEIYAQYQSQNQKKPTWTDVIAENLPNIAKIASAAFIKDPYQQGAVQESLSNEQAIQEARKQAYKQAQEQKAKDFLDITYKQMGLDTEAEKYKGEQDYREKTLNQKMQEQALKKLQEDAKAKQAQENWQKEYELKQQELDQKIKSGELKTPEQKELAKARGVAAINYKRLESTTPKLLKDVDRAIELADKAYSGVTAGIGEKLGRFGVAPMSKYKASEKLAATAELKLLTGQQVLNALSNLKGTVSDRDMAFMIDTMVGFDKATADEKKAKLNVVKNRITDALENARAEYESLGGVVEKKESEIGKKKDSLGIL